MPTNASNRLYANVELAEKIEADAEAEEILVDVEQALEAQALAEFLIAEGAFPLVRRKS